MSSGGQSNASQTPFAPNYGQAQGISGLGAGLTGGGFGSNMGGGNAYAQKFKQPSMGMFPPTSPQPQQGQPQPPPGLTVNTPGTQNGVSGYYSDSSMSNFVPDTPAGSFLGGPYDPAGGYFGGYGGGYSSPYMSPSMMGGLASLFGGMQGGGFQGMFNQQPQQQSYGSIQGNMAFDRQRMEALIDRPQQSRMIPLDQPDSNSFSLTRSYMDPVSGKISTVY